MTPPPSGAASLPEGAPAPSDHDDAFDPNLRSASLVEFGRHGARIHDVRLHTADGRDVNVLVRGGTYVVSYAVEFEANVERVRFGMMIKTTTGLELGGATLPPGSDLAGPFAAGERVRLAFTFRCRVFAGTYFLNAGLMGDVEGTHTYLHRLVDALAFRVRADDALRASGYVDLDVDARIEAIPA